MGNIIRFEKFLPKFCILKPNWVLLVGKIQFRRFYWSNVQKCKENIDNYLFSKMQQKDLFSFLSLCLGTILGLRIESLCKIF